MELGVIKGTVAGLGAVGFYFLFKMLFDKYFESK